MLNVEDMRSWSDVEVGILRNSIDPMVRKSVLVEIDYTMDVEPLPNPPFLFSIGGKMLRNGKSVDTREEVICVEKISDTEYVVDRDPLGLGTPPISHYAGDPVNQVVMGGSVKSIERQLDSALNQMLHIEEVIGVIGETFTILPCFKKQYSDNNGYFNVTLFSDGEKEKVLKVSPGIAILRLMSGLVRFFTISPEKEVYGVSIVSLKKEDFRDKTSIFIYINDEGYLETGFSLNTAYSDLNGNAYSLAAVHLTLNEDQAETYSIEIEDIRPEVMK